MERPGWAKVVGVIGAIVGAVGVFGSAQSLFMPKMIEMQREMMQQMKESAKQSDQGTFPEFPEQFFDYPGWFEEWSLVNGVVGVGLSAGCLLASIFLLTLRPGAPRLFILFSGLSLFWHGIRIVAGSLVANVMAWSLLPAAIFGIVVHAILLAVVLNSDRRAYASQAA